MAAPPPPAPAPMAPAPAPAPAPTVNFKVTSTDGTGEPESTADIGAYALLGAMAFTGMFFYCLVSCVFEHIYNFFII